jgi:hypothetical protein
MDIVGDKMVKKHMDPTIKAIIIAVSIFFGLIILLVVLGLVRQVLRTV